jgi:hypothetical protein
MDGRVVGSQPRDTSVTETARLIGAAGPAVEVEVRVVVVVGAASEDVVKDTYCRLADAFPLTCGGVTMACVCVRVCAVPRWTVACIGRVLVCLLFSAMLGGELRSASMACRVAHTASA